MGRKLQHVSLKPTMSFPRLSLWTNLFGRDEESQKQLIDLCKAVGERISSLVQAVRTSVTNHGNPATQLDLINESLAMIPVSLAYIFPHCHVRITWYYCCLLYHSAGWKNGGRS